MMVKEAVAEEPAALVTVMAAAPAFTSRLAGIEAVSCVGLTKMVSSGAEFQLALEAGVKAAPLTVIMNPALPAVIEEGVSVETAGVAGLTVKRTAEDCW